MNPLTLSLGSSSEEAAEELVNDIFENYDELTPGVRRSYKPAWYRCYRFGLDVRFRIMGKKAMSETNHGD